MHAAGVTGPVQVNMVLLEPPNSPAHLEKQGVELGTFLSILQGPSLHITRQDGPRRYA